MSSLENGKLMFQARAFLFLGGQKFGEAGEFRLI